MTSISNRPPPSATRFAISPVDVPRVARRALDSPHLAELCAGVSVGGTFRSEFSPHQYGAARPSCGRRLFLRSAVPSVVSVIGPFDGPPGWDRRPLGTAVRDSSASSRVRGLDHRASRSLVRPVPPSRGERTDRRRSRGSRAAPASGCVLGAAFGGRQGVGAGAAGRSACPRLCSPFRAGPGGARFLGAAGSSRKSA